MSDIMITTLDVQLQRRQAETYVVTDASSPCKKTDMLVDRIRQRLAALDMTPYAASLKASDGRSRDMIANILNGRSAHPRADTLEKLAGVLETTVDWLLNGDGPPPPPPLLATPPVPNVQFSDARVPTRSELGDRSLPVRGTAAGTLGKGAFQIDGEIDYVVRPYAVRHVKDAYAIYVVGDSMDPAHPHGELRIVHPHRPCQIGDTVVIVARFSEHGPSEAFIKRLVKRTGDKMIVEQFNPHTTIEFKTDYIESCHKVLTMNDLLGI